MTIKEFEYNVENHICPPSCFCPEEVINELEPFEVMDGCAACWLAYCMENKIVIE